MAMRPEPVEGVRYPFDMRDLISERACSRRPSLPTRSFVAEVCSFLS